MILSTEKMQEELQGWELPGQLPEAIGGFVKIPGEGIKGQILSILKYVNEEQHCSVELTYSSETGDFVPVKTIGLHSFRDVQYFYRDKDDFAEAMVRALPLIISSIDRSTEHSYSREADDYHFKNWAYGQSLPEKIGSYELFIRPDNPVSYINGSYIFLDYTDFATGNQLCFFYNIYRNEIFAEKKQAYLPVTTNDFTVMNKPLAKGLKQRTAENRRKDDESKLIRLESLLQKKLEQTLREL